MINQLNLRLKWWTSKVKHWQQLITKQSSYRPNTDEHKKSKEGFYDYLKRGEDKNVGT